MNEYVPSPPKVNVGELPNGFETRVYDGPYVEVLVTASLVFTSPGTTMFTKVALKSGFVQLDTVMVSVFAEDPQPMLSLNLKVTIPGAIAVTIPLLFTLAT